jgi:hypothetical protein
MGSRDTESYKHGLTRGPHTCIIRGMNRSDGPPSLGPAEYIEALRWKRAQTVARLEELERERDEIAARTAQVTNELRALDALLASATPNSDARTTLPLPSVPGVPVSEHVSIPENGRSGRFVRTTIPDEVYDATEAALKAANRPLHYTELAEIVQHKAPLRGKDPAATLLAHLSRARDRFVRVGRGLYWLASDAGADAPVVNALHTAPRKKRRKKRSR